MGNWINGTFVGVDISGSESRGLKNNINIYAANNIIGSNLDTTSDDAEINILNKTQDSSAVVALITLQDSNTDNTKINHNYLNKDKNSNKDFRSIFLR